MSLWFENHGFDRVATGLLIGAMPLDSDDLAQLVDAGVRTVYNLCEDSEYMPGQRLRFSQAISATNLAEKRLPLVDHGRLDREAIDRAVREVNESLEGEGDVYLHCRAGQQRSAAVAAGVMAIRDGIEVEEALEDIGRRRPGAGPLRRQRKSLLRWWRKRPAKTA